METTVGIERRGRVTLITINRPHVRNAVDRDTAQLLFDAFAAFDADVQADVAVLTGAGATFCAGADLQQIAGGIPNDVTTPGAHTIAGTPGPMGPTRLRMTKPVIAAIEGYAVAGGLELAVWADLRVMAADAVLGVFCRRWGVPLIDGGTVRLPRLIGQGRALDLILTGREVNGMEALAIGLVDRIAPPGEALDRALELAETIAAFPQDCLRVDRASAVAQWELTEAAALAAEVGSAAELLTSGSVRNGAVAFRNRPVSDSADSSGGVRDGLTEQ